MREIAGKTLADLAEFKRQRAFHGLYGGGSRSTRKHGPHYHAPQKKILLEGIANKMRWFHPSFYDTAIFFQLFQFAAGWNEATAMNLDISRDDWLDGIIYSRN